MSKRAKAGNPRKSVAYIRVSTEDQKLGPEAQRAAIESGAGREGVEVVAWHVDHASGAASIEERPGLLAALAGLRSHGAGLLLVAKRDRLARDVVVASMIEKAAISAGARVLSIDGVGNGDSPADAFMRTILDGAAAYERALIRARTKAALAVKKARGEKLGGRAPFGFKLASDGVHLEHEPHEQGVITRALELRRAGLRVSDIVRALANEGVRSRVGKPLIRTQVVNLLTANRTLGQ